MQYKNDYVPPEIAEIEVLIPLTPKTRAWLKTDEFAARILIEVKIYDDGSIGCQCVRV